MAYSSFVFLSRLRRGFVIAFCLWHMAAIGIYSLPADATDPVTVGIRNTFIPVFQGYLFITSQWQQWNLFSPDPIRRVTSYEIMGRKNNSAFVVARIGPDTLPVWRESDELKTLRSFEEQGDAWRPIVERYLAPYCKQVPKGTELTLLYHSNVIPKISRVMLPSWWRSRAQMNYTFAGISMTCSSVHP